MNECAHFKELILTGYIDGELEGELQRGTQSHLTACSDCRAFLKEVKNKATLPFKQILPQPVPEALWDAIKQDIERQNQSRHPLEGILDALKGLLVFPKMAAVFGCLVIFLAGSLTIHVINTRHIQATQQGEYLVSLLAPGSFASSLDNSGSGNPIEHYFL